MARPSPMAWLRRHPAPADSLLALLVAGTTLAVMFGSPTTSGFRQPDAGAAILVLLANLPIAFRRRTPAATLAVVTVAQMGIHLVGYEGAGWVGILVAVYSLGANVAPGRRRARTLGVFALAIVVFLTLGLLSDDVEWGSVVGTYVTLPAAFFLGDNLRRRRERLEDLAERAERAERERELLARERVAEERARIARDLHDVVAHSVSVMVIQAAAARRQLLLDPTRAEEALGTIELTGRQTMGELRRVLGALRDDSDAELAPQPSLDAIGPLLAADDSLATELRVEGVPCPVPASVELSAYRVVQEAITNVRKHGGEPSLVTVTLHYEPAALEITVRDDGRGAAAHLGGPGEGFGLLGMRERVMACHGELAVGPARGGGWSVRARFPLELTRLAP